MANWWEIAKMQNSHWILWKIAPKASNMLSQDVWKFTLVLQDIGPLGPLLCSHFSFSTITLSRALGTADHVNTWMTCYIYIFKLPYIHECISVSPFLNSSESMVVTITPWTRRYFSEDETADRIGRSAIAFTVLTLVATVTVFLG